MFGRRDHSAATAPAWSEVRVEQADQSLLCRVRTDPAVTAAQASHPMLIWITVEFLHTGQAGMPTAEELASLNAVDAALASMPTDHGMFVATVTGSDVREYLVYAATGDWVDELRKDVNDAIAPHHASVAVQEDPHWASFRRLVG